MKWFTESGVPTTATAVVVLLWITILLLAVWADVSFGYSAEAWGVWLGGHAVVLISILWFQLPQRLKRLTMLRRS